MNNVLDRPVVSTAKWTPLSAPVDPLDTQRRMRAQSYLSGSLLVSERCPSGSCPALDTHQAIDVLTWAGIII